MADAMTRIFPPPEPPPQKHEVCMPRITVRQLNRRGACLSQITEFRMRFGREAEVTVVACAIVCHDFDFEWATAELLHDDHSLEVEKAVAARLDLHPHDNYDLVVAEEFAKKYREVYPNVP